MNHALILQGGTQREPKQPRERSQRSQRCVLTLLGLVSLVALAAVSPHCVLARTVDVTAVGPCGALVHIFLAVHPRVPVPTVTHSCVVALACKWSTLALFCLNPRIITIFCAKFSKNFRMNIDKSKVRPKNSLMNVLTFSECFNQPWFKK